MPTSRMFSSHSLLIQLIFLCSLPRCGMSSENVGHEKSKHPIEQHYFSREIDFLAKQSMMLGGHSEAAPKAAMRTVDNEQIARLNFIVKSLRLELVYIRRLKAMDESRTNLDKKTGSTQQHSDVGNDKKEDTHYLVMGDIHQYDYDWILSNGFSEMHHELDCRSHAHDQDKELYSSEMWKTLWKKFQDSTLFPFPVPGLEECYDQPFYVAHTSDNKGRGVFASRNIPKGTLVHAGHPNTVFFPENKSFFRLLASLPQMMACDVMEWAWQQDLTDTGNSVLCLNLDEAVFFNDGGRDSMTNMEVENPTSLDFYASRDIEEGEELLYDYGSFDMDDEEMDL